MRSARLTLSIRAAERFCMAAHSSTAGFAAGRERGPGDTVTTAAVQRTPRPSAPSPSLRARLSLQTATKLSDAQWHGCAAPRPCQLFLITELRTPGWFPEGGGSTSAGTGALRRDSCVGRAAPARWVAPASHGGTAARCTWSGVSPATAPVCSESAPSASTGELRAAAGRLPWDLVRRGRPPGRRRRRRKVFGGGGGVCSAPTVAWGSGSKPSVPARAVARAGRFPPFPYSSRKPRYCFARRQHELGCCGQPDRWPRGRRESEGRAPWVEAMWCCRLTERWHVLSNSAESFSAFSNWPPQSVFLCLLAWIKLPLNHCL